MNRIRVSRLVAATLLAGAVLVLAGCGRGEDTSAPESPEAGRQGPSMERKADKQKSEKTAEEEEQKSEKEKEATSGSDGKNATSEKSGEKKEKEEEKAEKEDKEGKEQDENTVKLKPDLPKPMFAGTPSDLKTPLLEPNPEKGRGDIYVPEGATENIAKGKPVKLKGPPIMGETEYITDGDKSGRSGTVVTLGPQTQWAQVDLKKKYKIYGILVWHYHRSARVYHDVAAQVSNNKDFVQGVTTLFNNDQDNSSGLGVGEDYEYIEDAEGKWIEGDGVEARYVRLYSKGSTANELNHYVEIAVYGIPAE